MLRKVTTIAAVVCVLCSAGVLAPSVALANPPVTCPPGTELDYYKGTCVIRVRPPSGPVTPPGPGDRGGSGSRPVGGGPAKCTQGGSVVPCATSLGWWSQSHACYARAMSPQPPLSDGVWGGRTEGQIYNCVRPGGRDWSGKWTDADISFLIWLPSPPEGAPPDPRVLARDAVALMNLRAIDMGLVPESGPDRVGLVGLPNWMWVENPSPTTWGPVTRSASAGGFTVTATARVGRVSWDMGDGDVVQCGAGTPYQDSFGLKFSPTCGHRYERQGRYTVTAASRWMVQWSGMGQSGTIPMTLSTSKDITIGEMQVLNQ